MRPWGLKALPGYRFWILDPTAVTSPDLLQQLVVLHELLSQLVGGLSLRLKGSCAGRRGCQLVDQGDHPLHDPAKKQNTWELNRFLSRRARGPAGERRRLQPEKDSESGDVEVPLRSEQLHVEVIVHVGQQFGVCSRVSNGIFPHFANRI